MDKKIKPQEWTRYERHLALPEITPAHQTKLKNTHIVMIGAGGLGAPALPYLAGAGIGKITILDYDNVDETNLHRQTIYKSDQIGINKAKIAAQYLSDLNPHSEITAITEKLSSMENFECDLILDGSDNFETKTLLNDISIETKTPLISASVNRFQASCGIFAGFAADGPCYTCLFPRFPKDACNCNEAGILGTTAGLAGLYQAHMALCFLLGIGDIKSGSILSMDFKTMRTQHLHLNKNPNCASCCGQNHELKPQQKEENITPLVTRNDLENKDHVVIDVRQPEEVQHNPIDQTLNIPLTELPTRTNELPQNKTLAFVCSANIRSRIAAEMMQELGFENVCVLDRQAA